jgi:hypothetical protein
MPEIGAPPTKEPVDVFHYEDGWTPDPAHRSELANPAPGRRHRRLAGPAGSETATRPAPKRSSLGRQR